jgi:two-component system, NtrC family, response regulator HydG
MPQKLQILIVDDDQRMTHTLADILTISGHTAITAFSAAEALTKARTLNLDCVLTDIKMPVMSGLELYRQLRLVKPGLPVILMTAFAAQEVIRQGLEEGVVGVLDKPLDINWLLGFFTALSKNRTIVIVDDDPQFCKSLGDILQQRGFNVTQITDPHTDVEEMGHEAQVVLLDLKLNEVNGLDILKLIRDRFPTLPVLLVTGYRHEMADLIEQAQTYQVTVHLYKPLEIPSLLDILAQLQLTHLRDLIKHK